MQPKLSILIPTTTDRSELLERLLKIISNQIDLLLHLDNSRIYTSSNGKIEVLMEPDNKEKSVGTKRNILLSRAPGEYIAFIDDDDRISDNYFKLLFEGIEKDVDCCSLKGVITENGKNPLIFEHSIKYKEYLTNSQDKEIRYERYPNHLNCIKSNIAKKFKFPEVNHGEDTDWATQIFKSGLIKTEHYIDEFIYYYDWMTK